jgi:hypothetical protein
MSLPRKATFYLCPVVVVSNKPINMDHIRSADRNQLIRLCMVLGSLLSVLSFSLAQVPW